jgi:hypothetical protein
MWLAAGKEDEVANELDRPPPGDPPWRYLS